VQWRVPLWHSGGISHLRWVRLARDGQRNATTKQTGCSLVSSVLLDRFPGGWDSLFRTDSKPDHPRRPMTCGPYLLVQLSIVLYQTLTGVSSLANSCLAGSSYWRSSRVMNARDLSSDWFWPRHKKGRLVDSCASCYGDGGGGASQG
jgi:hypothetical protein